MSFQDQQLLVEHMKLIAKDPAVFANNAKRFRNLLNDHLPSLRTERFLLCCVFELPSFVTALERGRAEKADVSRVEFFLIRKLGFSVNYARLISETWAITLGLSFAKPSTAFKCPHCQMVGKCDTQWRDRLALCPSCNATIRFTSSLKVSLEQRGWPKKRVNNRKWVLLDQVSHQSSSPVKSAIFETIKNEDLSHIEIAEYIGLDLIVAVLQEEVETLLDSFGRKFRNSEERIVCSVIHGIFRDGEVRFYPRDNMPTPAELHGSSEQRALDERWVAVIGSSLDSPFRGVAFSTQALHYCDHNSLWSIPYVDLHQIPITLGKAITEIKLGEGRVINVKGLGVSRRSLLPAITIIAKCVNQEWITTRK